MGTRGYMGIKKKGELKGSYNHCDSYFEGLGNDIIQSINNIPADKRIDRLNEVFDRIELVDEKSTPTSEQIDYCIENDLVNLSVSSKSTDEWYCLLREAQGKLNLYINNNIKYMLNGNDFLKDELWCEYAYIINLDTNKLEIYEYGNSKLIMQRDLLDLDYEDMLKEYEHYYN